MFWAALLLPRCLDVGCNLAYFSDQLDSIRRRIASSESWYFFGPWPGHNILLSHA